MIWTAWVERVGDRFPTIKTKEGDQAPMRIGAPNVGNDGNLSGYGRGIPWHRAYSFSAETEPEAERVMQYLREHGVPRDPSVRLPVLTGPKVWRHRGHPHYLGIQGRAMGVSELLIKRAGACRELKDLNATLTGLNTAYHDIRQRRAGQISGFSGQDTASPRMSIAAAQQVVNMFYCMAASAQQMLDDASVAFELDPPTHTFAVMVAPDPIAQAEIAEARQTIEIQKTLVDTHESTIRRLSEELASFRVSTAEAKVTPEVPVKAVEVPVEPPASEPSTIPIEQIPKPATNSGRPDHKHHKHQNAGAR